MRKNGGNMERIEENEDRATEETDGSNHIRGILWSDTKSEMMRDDQVRKRWNFKDIKPNMERKVNTWKMEKNKYLNDGKHLL